MPLPPPPPSARTTVGMASALRNRIAAARASSIRFTVVFSLGGITIQTVKLALRTRPAALKQNSVESPEFVTKLVL